MFNMYLFTALIQFRFYFCALILHRYVYLLVVCVCSSNKPKLIPTTTLVYYTVLIFWIFMCIHYHKITATKPIFSISLYALLTQWKLVVGWRWWLWFLVMIVAVTVFPFNYSFIVVSVVQVAWIAKTYHLSMNNGLLQSILCWFRGLFLSKHTIRFHVWNGTDFLSVYTVFCHFINYAHRFWHGKLWRPNNSWTTTTV